jgi:hypothetical protein
MIKAPYTKYEGKWVVVDGWVKEVAYLARFYKIETSWKDFVVFYGITVTNDMPSKIYFARIYISKTANLTVLKAQVKFPIILRKIIRRIFKKVVDRYLD